jgi:exodeoxyribonuclease-1
MFWRNLIDPYGREWQNDCGRWDLLDVVRTAYALRPDGVVWPTKPDGSVSFKLTDLTAANGLVHEAAHDALSDVRATIAMARLIRAAQPRLFDFCFGLHKKDRVAAELGLPTTLAQARPFLHVSGMFPATRGCLALMWPLAIHPTNKNELVAWDLAHDPRELASMNADEIRLRLFTKTDALPDGMTRLPVKSVHLNKSPMVMSNWKILSPQMAQRWELDLDAQLRYAELARDLPDMSGIWPEVFRRPKEPPPDVDEDLYGGFVGNADRRRLNQLRELSSDKLAASRPAFDDPRLAELLFRYRARNFPHSLSEQEQQTWQQHRTARLLQGEAGARTLQGLFDELDRLAESADEHGEALLGALYDYADSIAP